MVKLFNLDEQSYCPQSGSTGAHTVFSLDLHSHTVLSRDLLRLTPSSVWIYRGSLCLQSGSTEVHTVLSLDLQKMILSCICIWLTSGSTENHTAFTLDLHTTCTRSGISYDTTTSSDLLACTLSDVQNYISVSYTHLTLPTMRRV